jgi:hypothetical protein
VDCSERADQDDPPPRFIPVHSVLRNVLIVLEFRLYTDKLTVTYIVSRENKAGTYSQKPLEGAHGFLPVRYISR